MMDRLVIVDDEWIVIQGIKALLQRIGAESEVVGTAQDGSTALSVIRDVRPDVVITDIRIPFMDGLSLIEACREFLPDASYLVISGYQDFEYARTALRLGALDYIDKPVTLDKLKAAFDRIQEHRKSHPADSAGAEPGLDLPETQVGEGHGAINRVLAYIQENYRKDIGLTELADLVGMNPAYLSVLFKEQVGRSFIKYLTGLRVDQAKKLLARGCKASEVGKAVGYNDSHYFYEIFKKNTGCTPSEWKKQ